MDRVNPLGTDKIHKLIIRFSGPAIVGMMVNSLYNFVDRIFIGNSPDLGADGLAGITIGFPIMLIIMSFGILFGIGGATSFSISLGEGHHRQAELSLGNALSMLILFGVFFMVIGQIALQPLLVLFGASESVLPYATAYMRVIFFGACFQIISMGMNNFIRADGNPRIAMLTMFISAFINIGLDALFIFGLRLGMTGAALATVIAQASSSLWVLLYFRGPRCRVRLQWPNMRLRPLLVLSMVTLGLPGFLLQLANSLINTVLNRTLLLYGGDIAVSAMGILHSIQTVLLMPIGGLRQGTQPIISFNYGARRLDRVRKASTLTILIATAIVCAGYLVTRLFPTQLIGLFNREPELLEFGTRAINAWLLLLPSVGIQFIMANFFQAIGRPRSAIFLTLTRQVIFLIPAVIIFPRIWGMNGLLHAAPFADGLSVLLTVTWYFVALRNLERDTRLLDQGAGAHGRSPSS